MHGSYSSAMSTLAEVENTVAGLPRREQEALLLHLTARLHSPPARRAGNRRKKSWPVSPPKVNKTESRRIMQRIEEQFGRVEWESWK